MRTFEADELRAKKPFKEPESFYPDPNDALKEYKKAKRLVQLLSAQYHTEYHSKYLNWSVPISVEPLEFPKQAKESSNGNHHSPDDTKSNNKIIIKSTGISAGKPSAIEKTNKNNDNGRFVLFDSSPIRNKPKASVPSSVDFIQVQSIYKALNPAGVRRTDCWRERRHYNIEIQQSNTFEMANEIFERSKRKL